MAQGLPEPAPESAPALRRNARAPVVVSTISPWQSRRASLTISDNTLLTSGVAYPKALHETLGAFDRDLENYWDWDWFLRVSARLPLIPLEPPGVLMSWRSSNSTANTSRDPFEPRRVALLKALSEKHKLGTIPPKNHRTVINTMLKV